MIFVANKEIFGRQVQQLRKKYHLSQKALAALVGVSVHSIRGWETGVLEPQLSPETLRRLCQVFNTTQEQFFKPIFPA